MEAPEKRQLFIEETYNKLGEREVKENGYL
jgi:hypothetical protein